MYKEKKITKEYINGSDFYIEVETSKNNKVKNIIKKIACIGLINLIVLKVDVINLSKRSDIQVKESLSNHNYMVDVYGLNTDPMLSIFIGDGIEVVKQ